MFEDSERGLKSDRYLVAVSYLLRRQRCPPPVLWPDNPACVYEADQAIAGRASCDLVLQQSEYAASTDVNGDTVDCNCPAITATVAHLYQEADRVPGMYPALVCSNSLLTSRTQRRTYPPKDGVRG